MKIPITKPFIDEEEKKACFDTIASGWVSQGPKVSEFEDLISNYVDTKYGIATSSCTSALHVALLTMGIKPGDEVITPSFTFIATANSVLHAGAKPVFVDIDEKTYNIDSEKIEEKITEKTKLIMPVHQVGLPADMDIINKIAKKNNLNVLEDAACAIGSKYKGRLIGSINTSCFSFHPRKSITTGEGGMIVTNDKQIEKLARILRSHGASISDLERHKSDKIIFEEYSHLGYNYRMTDIQASIGIKQFNKLDFILKRRKELAKRYDDLLKYIDSVIVPFVPSDCEHNYQSYMIRINSEKISRNELIQKMLEKGIATSKGVMAIHKSPYYTKRFGNVHLPITEKVTDSTIIIPLFTEMTEEQQDYVIDNLKIILK
jgi:dTDP-4-amino-4,6-dideoxygalactose transaminase